MQQQLDIWRMVTLAVQRHELDEAYALRHAEEEEARRCEANEHILDSDGKDPEETDT